MERDRKLLLFLSCKAYTSIQRAMERADQIRSWPHQPHGALETRLGRVNVAPLPVGLAQLVPGLHHGRVQLDGLREERLGLRGVLPAHVDRPATLVEQPCPRLGLVLSVRLAHT